jgi:hypothetical protein
LDSSRRPLRRQGLHPEDLIVDTGDRVADYRQLDLDRPTIHPIIFSFEKRNDRLKSSFFLCGAKHIMHNGIWFKYCQLTKWSRRQCPNWRADDRTNKDYDADDYKYDKQEPLSAISLHLTSWVKDLSGKWSHSFGRLFSWNPEP